MGTAYNFKIDRDVIDMMKEGLVSICPISGCGREKHDDEEKAKHLLICSRCYREYGQKAVDKVRECCQNVGIQLPSRGFRPVSRKSEKPRLPDDLFEEIMTVARGRFAEYPDATEDQHLNAIIAMFSQQVAETHRSAIKAAYFTVKEEILEKKARDDAWRAKKEAEHKAKWNEANRIAADWLGDLDHFDDYLDPKAASEAAYFAHKPEMTQARLTAAFIEQSKLVEAERRNDNLLLCKQAAEKYVSTMLTEYPLTIARKIQEDGLKVPFSMLLDQVGAEHFKANEAEKDRLKKLVQKNKKPFNGVKVVGKDDDRKNGGRIGKEKGKKGRKSWGQ